MTEVIKNRVKDIWQGNVPDGYYKTNSGSIPADWESIPLRSLVEEISETTGSSIIETVSISAGIGFVNQAKKFGKELSGKQYEKYIVLHRGDFSYNKGNSTMYPQGCVYRLKDREQAAVPNVFESFRVINGNADYYEQLFISGFLNRQLYSKINRGVRDDGLLNLTGEEFYNCEVPFPPFDEQLIIAEILMHCDNVITLYQQQLDELKKAKSCFLRKMFPQQGETTPQIRFPGFTSPWEQRKYADVIDLISGQDFTPNEYNDEGIGIPYMTGASCIHDGKTVEMRWTLVPKCIAERDDVLLVCKGSGYGTLARLTQEKAHIARQFMALKCKPELNNTFNYYLADSVVNNIKTGAKGLIAGIDRSTVLDQYVLIPYLDEQKQIGEYFLKLDNLTTLHQLKLDEARREKKALMQLLLTGIVRVKT